MSDALREEIERVFNLKIINEQYLPWGEFYWLELTPTSHKSQSSLSIVKVYPFQEQKLHPHAGYEEIIIGIEGELTHWCDDREFLVQKGQAGYINSGGQHRILNNSDLAAMFISIVTPVIPTEMGELSPVHDVELVELIEMIKLELITDKFSQSVGLAVTLISVHGEKLTEPKNLPEF
ncbi:MAG TPA: cupin domain-containing protein, partial [Desulfosporosinus sp.]|nr:cupin domain-containing protein [Desulfosporosinus sp.]